MEQLKILKLKRSTHRSLVTRLLSKIETCLNVKETSPDTFEEHLEQLMVYSNTLKELNSEIGNLLKFEEIESDILSSAEYEEKIISFKTKLNRRIRQVDLANSEQSGVKNTSLTSSDSETGKYVETKTVKLPKLVINKYFGDPDKYLDFWNQYESAIHKNSSLSDVDKFNYLKSLLGGVAANAICGFSLTEKNYAAAIKLLKDRFGRRDMLVHAHLNIILNLTPLKNSNDIRGLRNLYDKCETQIRSLESLEVSENTYCSILCPILLKLLPPDLTLEFTRKQDKDKDWSVEEIIIFLKDEIESRERAYAINKPEETAIWQNESKFYGKNRSRDGFKTHYKHANKKQHSEYNKVSSATELLTSIKEDLCIFCKSKDHISKKCNFLSVNEKRDILKTQGRCYLCLETKHRVQDCKSKVFCSTCNGKHNETLCYKNENKSRNENLKSNNIENSVSNLVSNGKTKVLLQTAAVKLIGESSNKTICCLFDSGSQRTFIRKDVSRQLSLKQVGQEDLMIYTFRSKVPTRQSCARVEVKIKGIHDSRELIIEALEIDEISHAELDYPPEHIRDLLKEKGIFFADVYENSSCSDGVSLLIGADNYWTIITGKIERLNSTLVAMESKLGWLLMGNVLDSENQVDDKKSKHVTSACSVISFLIHSSKIENLWKLDLLGIQDPVETKCRKEMETAALNHFEETLTFGKDRRYEVHLPWIEEKGILKPNLNIAKQRLITTTNRLIGKGKYEEYEHVFEDWLKEGIIEDVPVEEIDNNCHYLPHRGVFKENSTTKLRPVFDASCREKNSPSLNDCLEKGPNLLEQIIPILLRFRKYKIGVLSDIKKAFLQMSIAKADREFLRFLWWNDFEAKEFRIFRHKRVVFGLNCSPFLLAAVLNHHIELNVSRFPETSEILKKSFYVDNCVTSVPDETTLYRLIEESKQMLVAASFDLRGWEYNTLFESVNYIEPTSVLGILWDKKEDNLFCDVKVDIDKSMNPTKRNILSTVHKIFDPLGLLCPITLVPKCLIQKTWKLKLGWDMNLPEDLAKEFISWTKDLSLLSNIKIPRCLDVYEEEGLTLHVFCDASQQAYGSVVYLRKVREQGVSVYFLLAKSRVSPLRKITIPRLELLSCCIGVRLTSLVLETLHLKTISTFYWTDSTTALSWIQRDDNWAPFVANRVKEIRTLSSKSEWHHVPGNVNPADLPSRGCSVKTLLKSCWLQGPEWLRKSEEEWPSAEAVTNEEEIMRERRKGIISTLASTSTEDKWYLRHFSRYFKIVKMIGWILRFINNCKNADRNFEKILNVEEISIAEKKLMKITQRESLSNDEKLKGHFTFIDEEGIMRLKTKILRRNDEEDFRCPIVLPSKHELVERMIRDYHLQYHHAGTQVVLTNIRQRFWIIRGRKTVQRVLSKCVRCKRHSGKSIDTVPCPLPEDRVRDAYAFEVTGIDVAGPLYLKNGTKSWILLFTCGVYRAVHLELIESLTTNGFLLGFRRFIARRGRPRIVYSDNGTNFVGAAKLLRSIDWNKIADRSSVLKIQWKFNPPTAAWWGGWWERLIQMMKKLLRRVIGRASLSYEEMLTVLCDAEATINSRPLTYLSEDSTDLTPLTPSMFIQDVKTEGVPDLDRLDKVNLTKRWKYQQTLREEFRKRFRDEYLGLLIHRPKKQTPSKSIGKNDIVLVENDKKKRINWPIGRVIELYPGKDKNVRVVKVRTENGELIRPVQRLVPLEIHNQESFCELLHTRDKTSAKTDNIDCTKKELHSTSIKNVDSDKNSDIRMTRYGRRVVKPKHLN